MNKVHVVTTVEQVQAAWPFFLGAMASLNDPKGARCSYTPESFFLMLLRAIDLGPRGLVIVLTSKNNKPLGCGVAFEATDFLGESCFFIWAAYSNNKFPGTMREMQQYTEQYARSRGHKTIMASTKRVNTAAIRLFEKAWGFQRSYITFRKDI